MNILIPMAGAGSRFSENGYNIHKPAIPTIYHRNGEEYPMVVCATLDLPEIEIDGSNIIYIDRDFHKKDGVETQIKSFFPKSKFITIDYLTQGQASTCLLAKEYINNDNQLLIAGCDNGMIFNMDDFNSLKENTDILVFTYKNNESVCQNPNQYGWVIVDDDNNILDVSVKKSISDTPMNDNAIVATFWFRQGDFFVKSAEKMINENDRINNEFYVDQVIKHSIQIGYKAKVFIIDRYIGWGTPTDYENYMNTYKYWSEFVKCDGFLGE